MSEIVNGLNTWISEELIGGNPGHLEITQYTGRLPRMSTKRARELFGSICIFMRVSKALDNGVDVFVCGEEIHILYDEGLKIIPKMP